MQYIFNQEPVDDFTKRLSSIVAKIKYQSMNLHDRDNFRRGLKEGSQQAKIETAKNLLSLGDSIEKVAQVTDLEFDEEKSLIK